MLEPSGTAGRSNQIHEYRCASRREKGRDHGVEAGCQERRGFDVQPVRRDGFISDAPERRDAAGMEQCNKIAGAVAASNVGDGRAEGPLAMGCGDQIRERGDIAFRCNNARSLFRGRRPPSPPLRRKQRRPPAPSRCALHLRR